MWEWASNYFVLSVCLHIHLHEAICHFPSLVCIVSFVGSFLFHPFPLLTLWSKCERMRFHFFNFSRAHFIPVFIFKFPFMYLRRTASERMRREGKRAGERIVCRFFDYIFCFLLLLSFWNPPFLPSLQHFLLHAIFICIHNFFFPFRSIQFSFCSSIVFFIRFLNYCCRAHKEKKRKIICYNFFLCFISIAIF